MSRPADRWIRWTTTGCVALLALIAGTVSYLHMHLLVDTARSAGLGRSTHTVVGRWDDRGGVDHTAGRLAGGGAWRSAAVGAAGGGQRGESGRQRRGGPADRGRAGDRGVAIVRLIGAYELLMRQVRHGAAGAGGGKSRQETRPRQLPTQQTGCSVAPQPRRDSSGPGRRAEGSGAGGSAGRELQRQAWHWALAHRAGDGSLPSGSQIVRQYGRHERWGRLVKRAGAAGEFDESGVPSQPGLHLLPPQRPSGG